MPICECRKIGTIYKKEVYTFWGTPRSKGYLCLGAKATLHTNCKELIGTCSQCPTDDTSLGKWMDDVNNTPKTIWYCPQFKVKLVEGGYTYIYGHRRTSNIGGNGYTLCGFKYHRNLERELQSPCLPNSYAYACIQKAIHSVLILLMHSIQYLNFQAPSLSSSQEKCVMVFHKLFQILQPECCIGTLF